jgi:hypothetical protein
LLLPAGALSFFKLPLDDARQQVSFTLFGPFCLAVCAVRFQSLRLNPAGIQRLGLMLMGPIAGVAAIALFKLATTDADFTLNSNFAASGGYGPNQVSAILSLGGLLAVFLCLNANRSRFFRPGMAIVALWLLAQAALTFSRTGIYLFSAAFGAAAIFLIQRRGAVGRLLFVVVLLIAAVCAILPMLNAFTRGKLEERFSDKGLTGRDDVAKMDMQIWLEHPVLGAGAGVSTYYRVAEMNDDHAAHTEYTRLLADHGLLGAGALIVLLVMTTLAFLRAHGPWARAIVSALAVWAFLFMAVTAMRLAAPAFLLGLVHARFLAELGTKQSVITMARAKARQFGLIGTKARKL